MKAVLLPAWEEQDISIKIAEMRDRRAIDTYVGGEYGCETQALHHKSGRFVLLFNESPDKYTVYNPTLRSPNGGIKGRAVLIAETVTDDDDKEPEYLDLERIALLDTLIHFTKLWVKFIFDNESLSREVFDRTSNCEPGTSMADALRGSPTLNDLTRVESVLKSNFSRAVEALNLNM